MEARRVWDGMGEFTRARARMRVLPDAELVAAMRAGDRWAWSEFVARFRPVLEAHATRLRLSDEAWERCVDDVLADAAERFVTPNAVLPERIAGYLVRAARHRYLSLRRTLACHERLIADQADTNGTGERFVYALSSAHALRSTRDAAASLEDASGYDSDALRALAERLRAATTEQEQAIMGWLAERVPHRTIATWLDAGYDATTKRIWRLCRKLRGVAERYVAERTGAERAELERLLRRARPGAREARSSLEASSPRHHGADGAGPRRETSLHTDSGDAAGPHRGMSDE